MRYAKALMAYACHRQAEETLYEEMRTLAGSLEKNRELTEALADPLLPLRTKYRLIRAAAAGGAPVERVFARFIVLVLKNRREGQLRSIALSFIDLYRSRRHISVARLTTAVPLCQRVWERISERASSKLHAQVELHTEVDPSIGGGFIFDVNGYRLDASMATQLKKVKRQFIEKNRRIV